VESTGDVGPNSVSAVVSDIVYLGVECKIIADIGKQSLQVRTRDLNLMNSLAPGAAVVLSWKPEDAIMINSAH
ncbi:TOBE domain-containing protein, partial [Mesorhizobium sp. M7A.F.Ca.US.011.01.1.1]|uniref:TOBE domain-containing protein n=1 Tax=Mesorhizobium sp. M7A.F.Ca.US.011.01.1.1 TaxID=2496741 RepID=UPI000FCC135B